jgi:two-component system, NtrC family, response regulator GlrR
VPHPDGPSTVAHEAASSSVLVQSVRLTVIAGPDRGLSCELPDERLVVGTHRGAGLVLKDDTVSRFHCELVREDRKLVLRDLGSRNGTTVDGVTVREALLRPGSAIGVGATALRVDTGPDSVRVPLTANPGFGDMVGTSLSMRRVFAQLERAAASDATILLLGDTGTGKEAAAEAVHRASKRADQPFVAIDCGAIPAELLESELFGHERGAFTGAVRARTGAFRSASGGTVFLDEIGELPRDLQPKLLRALAQRTVKPVGAEEYVDVDVRVVAATNRDLRSEVNADRFRGDLYYRLAVIEIHLPPLRDRLDDLPGLVARLLDELPGSGTDKARLLSPASLAGMRAHAWPGNVRELRNVLERTLALGGALEQPPPAAAAASPPPVAEGDVPVDLARPFREARDAWTARFERAYLAALLAEHQGNIRGAARAAGIDRVHLYRLLDKYDLR